jgi:hypothetical protein
VNLAVCLGAPFHTSSVNSSPLPNYDISVISADGSDYRRVIDTPERDFAPVWLQFGDW